jgi:predicted acylesterase/phospholipase RssA
MTEQCDLVMKGGITSGVVYPGLIARLASKYQFKNVGGTSAGAIAAGACAAAQYGRKHTNPQAFDSLEQLPQVLSMKVTPDNQSKLFSLFQPAPSTRAYFSVLSGALNQSPGNAVRGVAKGIARMHKMWLGAGLLFGSVLLCPIVTALGLGLGHFATFVTSLCLLTFLSTAALYGLGSWAKSLQSGIGLLAAVYVALIFLLMFISDRPVTWQVIAIAAAITVVGLLTQCLTVLTLAGLFIQGLLKALHGNNYGLCSGKTPDDRPGPNEQGLTDWLTVYLNTLAGLETHGKPLTFGHLWGNVPGRREINLEMMTTAVSQQMVYSLPFRDDAPTFYYDRDEWAKLFPAQVMAFLDDLADAANAAGQPMLKVKSPAGRSLRRLSAQAELPVVIAVRMSLSFPVLLSAIPLYAIDWSMRASAASKDAGVPVEAKRVWFSDGGIGSNMPLHFFDSLLPSHPTFAINLKASHDDYPIKDNPTSANGDGRIYLPENNMGGRQRFWANPNDGTPVSGLVGFFTGIVNTMQSWRDELMFPYPGYRDRIVQISLRPDEGGLNLSMPSTSIEALGEAGTMCADRLIARFHPSTQPSAEGWQEHRIARMKSFLGVMQPAFVSLNQTLSADDWNACLTGYKPAELKVATAFLSGVQVLGNPETAQGVSLDTRAPKPLGTVKITPKI